MDKLQGYAQEAQQQILSARSTALSKVGLTEADLQKITMLPLITGIAGLFIIILVWGAAATPAWVKGTAMYQGQPFEAHLSLTDVQFGATGSDSQTVCGYAPKCSLSYMCDRTDIPVDVIYGNNFPKFTPPEIWCRARAAGASTLSLVWCAEGLLAPSHPPPLSPSVQSPAAVRPDGRAAPGCALLECTCTCPALTLWPAVRSRRLGFIPGAIATGLTLAYAAKQIDQVGKLFLQAEKKGFTDKIQKVDGRPAC